MSIFEVGLGDSPMQIAQRITGDARRYTELLRANPHKSLVHVAGAPTFASLGVGEQILLPDSFGVGDSSPIHGVRDQNDLHALQLELTGQGPNAKRGYAHVDNGNLVIEWPYQDGGWSNADPRNHAEMLTVYGIPASAPFYPTLLSKLGLDPKTPVHSWSTKVSRKSTSGGFDVGSAFNDAWNAVKSGVNAVGDVAATFHIPGANFTAALLTGADPIAGLKKDAEGFMDSAAIAKGIVSGDPGPLIASAKAGLKHLTGIDPGNALDGPIAAAVAKKDPGAAMSAVFQAASGAGGAATDPNTYANAWKVATHDGQIASTLPAPPGLNYHSAPVPASPANMAVHPVAAVASKPPVTLSLKGKTLSVPAAAAAPVATAPAAPPALTPVTAPAPAAPVTAQAPAPGAYGPYPKQ